MTEPSLEQENDLFIVRLLNMTGLHLGSYKLGVRQESKFGAFLTIFLILFGTVLLAHGKVYFAGIFFATFVATWLVSIVDPFFIKIIYKYWMIFAKKLGWFNTRLIIILIYYFIITPVGFYMRKTGYKFLDLDFDKSKDSYWIDIKDKDRNKESYLHPF